MSVARVAVGIGGNLVGTLSGTTALLLRSSPTLLLYYVLVLLLRSSADALVLVLSYCFAVVLTPCTVGTVLAS